MENKNFPSKSISYGTFQLTEWEKQFTNGISKSYALSCRIYNKEKQDFETQSTLHIDKKHDISILKYLIREAFLGRIPDNKKINQYAMICDRGKNIYKLSKEYKTKEGEVKYSTLLINYQADFLILIDLLERTLAYLIKPDKHKKSDNAATNVADGRNFVSEIDDDIPF